MRMRALCLVLATILLPAVAGAQPRPRAGEGSPTHAQTIDLTLIVGENKTIPASGVTSYSVGTPGILDVKVTPNGSSPQFVFVGAKPGSTTVLMIMSDGSQVTYAVTVYAQPPEKVLAELKELLEGYTGLRIRRVGPRFFIEGGVATDGDVRRISVIAGLYPGQVESLVVVGSVGIEHTINVRVDFYFVQYDKSSNYSVGLAWPGQFGNGAVSFTHDFVSGDNTAGATIDSPLPTLDLAQTRGWAKVLKHSTVVTTSGSEATFENGGEQNFAVAAGLTGSVQAIKFGTNLTVVPRYDVSSHDLEVKVTANVSDLTAPASGGGLPGRKTSQVNTFVHLKLGQSIVLSGIRSSSTTHSVTGIPLLSQIPVLGLLFGAHTNSDAEIEGAVFIIPSIVESVPRKAYDIVDAAMKQYDDYSGDIDRVNSFAKTPPNYKK